MAVHVQRQIENLKQKILFVGTLVEEAIAKSISALMNRDRNLARTVIDEDDEIDRMEVDVEEEVLKTLAFYQPVAADLRFVVAVLKINNDLERMGDLAKNIAKRVMFLTQCERVELPAEFRTMSAKTQAMVKQSLDALVNSDTALARKVREADDEVDHLRSDIQKHIEQQIVQSPKQTECLMRLTSVSRHLERLADMATNIAEDVIYMVEGEIVRHHRPTEALYAQVVAWHTPAAGSRGPLLLPADLGYQLTDDLQRRRGGDAVDVQAVGRNRSGNAQRRSAGTVGRSSGYQVGQLRFARTRRRGQQRSGPVQDAARMKIAHPLRAGGSRALVSAICGSRARPWSGVLAPANARLRLSTPT